jgi:hypothetical protein
MPTLHPAVGQSYNELEIHKSSDLPKHGELSYSIAMDTAFVGSYMLEYSVA